MKYTIKIIKESEPSKDIKDIGRYMERGYDQVMFQAGMDSDETIEILQHLHDLKNKGKHE